MKTPQYRSRLSQARGHGSAKDGVMHWWLQRVTALALIPLTVWFLASLLSATHTDDPFQVVDWLASPLHAVPMLGFIVALFWHAKLGMQVVIEDYVHTPGAKYVLLLGNTFFSIGAAIVSILAVLKLHMFNIVSGL